MSELQKELEVSVVCPRCRAAVGEPCVFRAAQRTRVHLQRADKAIRLETHAKVVG